jgi:hypothetical protein
MFPRMNLTSPVAYCPPQYGGVAFGGISPIMNPYACGPNPYACGPNPYACSPIAAALCGIGASPYAGGIGAAPGIVPQVAPFLQSPIGHIGSPFQAPAWCPPSLVSSPVTCIDPVTGAHCLLPIRPLINPQACDPITLAALCGVAAGQVTDPYSAALAQACMTPPLAVSPVHPALRPQVGVPQMAMPCAPVVAIPGVNC